MWKSSLINTICTSFVHCKCIAMVLWTAWQLGVAMWLSSHQWNGCGSDGSHFLAGAWTSFWKLDLPVGTQMWRWLSLITKQDPGAAVSSKPPTLVEISLPVLSNSEASSHTWLLNAWRWLINFYLIEPLNFRVSSSLHPTMHDTTTNEDFLGRKQDW